MAIVEQDFIVEAAFQEDIWRVGIDPPIRFASGKEADNKVTWDNLFVNPNDVRDLTLTPAGKVVVGMFVEVVDREGADALTGVHAGGLHFANAIGHELNIPVAQNEKDRNEPGLKTYRYVSSRDEAVVAECTRLGIIEDATSEFTSLLGMVQLVTGTERRGRGPLDWFIRALHRRDDGSNELELPKNAGKEADIDWMVELPMPNMMTAEHPTYKRWGHLAVGQLEPLATAQPAES